MVGISIIAKCDAVAAIAYRLRMTALTFTFQHATHVRAGPARGESIFRATLGKERTGGTAAENIRKREKIYQAIIAYRKTTKHLPEEESAALDRQIAEYSNNQVKQKPARKK